jgi:hypothetical protein
MRNRRAGLVISAAILLALAARHPSANISILTHDSSDPAPHRFQAAVDMGLIAVSVLVTWTNKRLS